MADEPNETVKRYPTPSGRLTVVWQPGLCTHSKRCWKGLPGVFEPRRRPWIDTAQADDAAIEAQVAQCPSGALTIEKSGGQQCELPAGVHEVPGTEP